MVRRRHNPFAAKQTRLPYRAYLRRSDPLHPADADELEAVMLSIAAGSESLSYAGTLEPSRARSADPCRWQTPPPPVMTLPHGLSPKCGRLPDRPGFATQAAEAEP